MPLRDAFCALCLAACAYLTVAEFHEATHPHAHYSRPVFTRETVARPPEHTHQEFARTARIVEQTAAVGGGGGRVVAAALRATGSSSAKFSGVALEAAEQLA